MYWFTYVDSFRIFCFVICCSENLKRPLGWYCWLKLWEEVIVWLSCYRLFFSWIVHWKKKLNLTPFQENSNLKHTLRTFQNDYVPLILFSDVFVIKWRIFYLLKLLHNEIPIICQLSSSVSNLSEHWTWAILVTTTRTE